MQLRIRDKKRAIILRQRGYSYNEIREKIPNLSKGTLSGWLKNIVLNKQQKQRIANKIKNAADLSRLKGSWTNKKKSLDRIKDIQSSAEQEYTQLANDELFNIGLSLYWAEGAKRSRCFQFMNSDPDMIKLMMKWLRDILRVPEQEIKIRIFIHKIYSGENCEKFWSEITAKPQNEFKRTVYKPSLHTVKKNPEYKGCCRIEITKSELFWKIQKWQEMLLNKF